MSKQFLVARKWLGLSSVYKKERGPRRTFLARLAHFLNLRSQIFVRPVENAVSHIHPRAKKICPHIDCYPYLTLPD